jgi:FAD/FMN-containing dehydrogenase
MIAPVSADVISRLKAVLGEGGWSQDPERIAPKLVEWRDRWHGETPLLALPRTVGEVSAVIGVCFESGTAVTPQGGNTGLVAGQIPQGEILLSTERLRAIREVAPLDDAIVVEAGVTLEAVQQAAAEAGRYFPLSLAAEGSATIGGVVSTNAGGTAVLRYGVTRDLVLGLEAVLPNGAIFHGLKRLRKDNTGYDLKQLLIGAEGTLGVVTAASLKLFPALVSRATAMAGLKTAEDAVRLLARAKALSGGQVEAFEIMQRAGVVNAVRHIPGVREPLEGVHAWYVLIEIASGQPGSAEASLEAILAEALETDLIQDVVVAQSDAQAKALWKVREEQSAAQKPEGMCWKFDVSVPVSQMAAFIAEASAEVERLYPGVRPVSFGHVGDGNVHFDVVQPIGPKDGEPGRRHDQQRPDGTRLVHDIVARYGGSISAEHGLGAMKTAEAELYKSPVELEALRALRRALDPKRIMNPRVLF